MEATITQIRKSAKSEWIKKLAQFVHMLQLTANECTNTKDGVIITKFSLLKETLLEIQGIKHINQISVTNIKQ